MTRLLTLSLLSLTFSISAFDIKSVDETNESKIDAKTNKKALDGKTIYTPIESIILNPMVPKVVQGNKPIVNPLSSNIIYPIGISPPKSLDNNAKEFTLPEEDDIFITKDEIKKSNDNKEIKIKLDAEFEKNAKPDFSSKKLQKISPVNIE